MRKGTVSYDKAIGMSVINFAQSPFGLPLRVYAIRQSNQIYTTVQVFVVQTYTDAMVNLRNTKASMQLSVPL